MSKDDKREIIQTYSSIPNFLLEVRNFGALTVFSKHLAKVYFSKEGPAIKWILPFYPQASYQPMILSFQKLLSKMPKLIRFEQTFELVQPVL